MSVPGEPLAVLTLELSSAEQSGSRQCPVETFLGRERTPLCRTQQCLRGVCVVCGSEASDAIACPQSLGVCSTLPSVARGEPEPLTEAAGFPQRPSVGGRGLKLNQKLAPRVGKTSDQGVCS